MPMEPDEGHKPSETKQRRRGRWRTRFLAVLILAGCVALGAGVYGLLSWLSAEEGPPKFVEPEFIPDREAEREDSDIQPLRADQLTTVIDLPKSATPSGVTAGRFLGTTVAGVDIALAAWSSIDSSKLPPVENPAMTYVGITLAAASHREKPVSVDSLSIEAVTLPNADEEYLPEFIELAPGRSEIAADGTPVAFRTVFILPRASGNLGLRVTVWGTDGRGDWKVLPDRPYPAPDASAGTARGVGEGDGEEGRDAEGGPVPPG